MEKSKRGIIIGTIVLGLLFVFNIVFGIYLFITNSTEFIFNANILKVVEIRVSDNETDWGYATGSFIDDSGTILTNKHVVVNSETGTNYSFVMVRRANDENYVNAQVISVSENYDLAKIKIDSENTKYFKFASNINNGESIYTIGNPNGFGLSFTAGVISSSSRIVIYNAQEINAIQTDFVINEGNSGGPVFNKYGKIIGIISFRSKDRNENVIQGVSFAIPVADIEDFLN